MIITIEENNNKEWEFKTDIGPIEKTTIDKTAIDFINTSFQFGIMNDREKYTEWYKANLKQKKEILKDALRKTLYDFLNECLEDINLFVTIKKFKDNFKATKKLFKVINKRGYSNIEGLKTEITEEEYYYFLECLPPLDFNGSTFFMSEYLTGDITTKFYIKDNKYYAEVVKHISKNRH